jgi:alpha-D-ribose 1-methylphosphonate 5-triphosphate synthase subunit PhnH
MTGLALGFADPVSGSQQAFGAVMHALASPGEVRAFATDLVPPRPLMPELAAVALALADHEAPLWLDESLAAAPAVAEYLRFHTGAAIVEDPADSAFALICEPRLCPSFDAFALGTPEYPDRSTTIVLAVTSLDDGPGLRLRGPGIETERSFAPNPQPDGFREQILRNRSLFPLGVDWLIVASGKIAGLPRSVKIVGGS